MLEPILLVILIILVLAIGAVTLLLFLKENNANSTDIVTSQQLAEFADRFDRELEQLEKSFREEAALNRKEAGNAAREGRTELAQTLKNVGDSMSKQLNHAHELQGKQFEGFSQRLGHVSAENEKRLEAMRKTVEDKLKQLQEDNTAKLEQMRKTVDEKLQGTLEKRLGESFKLVSDRLEKVQRGLGEMQNLATGVGDLKRVMTGIKTRGTWGEVQLGRLLEDIFTQAQYDTNIATVPGSNNRVEFAIRLPGHGDDDQPMYLPIDAKFPIEDYDRIVQATEAADPEGIAAAKKALEARITASAKDISDKYLAPPHTTDFGIMFLPTEGLYAEVVRNPGLVDNIRRNHRVAITGPSTITAFLSSLQVGFRTLAIEKRSSEVWATLAEVKVEFAKFGEVMEKIEKQVGTVSNTIKSVKTRTRAMDRKLRDVESLPLDQQEPKQLLDLVDEGVADDENDDQASS